MKMVMAVVRLKVMEKVTRSLEGSGMTAMARLDVYGMGVAEQHHCPRAELRYAQDPALLMIVDSRPRGCTGQGHRRERQDRKHRATAGSSSPQSRPPIPSAPVSRGSDCSPRSIAEEILMLKGESGCVKTALPDTMAALMPPDSGKITLGRLESVRFMHGISKGVGI